MATYSTFRYLDDKIAEYRASKGARLADLKLSSSSYRSSLLDLEARYGIHSTSSVLENAKSQLKSWKPVSEERGLISPVILENNNNNNNNNNDNNIDSTKNFPIINNVDQYVPYYDGGVSKPKEESRIPTIPPPAPAAAPAANRDLFSVPPKQALQSTGSVFDSGKWLPFEPLRSVRDVGPSSSILSSIHSVINNNNYLTSDNNFDINSYYNTINNNNNYVNNNSNYLSSNGGISYNSYNNQPMLMPAAPERIFARTMDPLENRTTLFNAHLLTPDPATQYFSAHPIPTQYFDQPPQSYYYSKPQYLPPSLAGAPITPLSPVPAPFQQPIRIATFQQQQQQQQ